MNRPTQLVLVIAAAVGVFAGFFAVRKAFEYFRAPTELRDWRSHTVAGLVFDAPGEFKIRTVDFGAAEEFIESSEMRENKVTGFEIDLVRTVYKSGIDLNFDGAVMGAVNGLKQLDGVTNVEHTATEQTISGKPARRLSVTASRWRKTLHLEAVLISDGQTYYQVQAIFDSTNPRGQENAEHLLKSVRLAP